MDKHFKSMEWISKVSKPIPGNKNGFIEYQSQSWEIKMNF
jgi:hypothetical protein